MLFFLSLSFQCVELIVILSMISVFVRVFLLYIRLKMFFSLVSLIFMYVVIHSLSVARSHSQTTCILSTLVEFLLASLSLCVCSTRRAVLYVD